MIAEHLQQTRDAFVAATRGLSDAQSSFRPDASGWSIANIVEHMALADRLLLGVVTRIPEGAAPSAGKSTGPERFARLNAMVPSRERRINAPSPLVPKGTWPTLDAALAAFLEARASLIAIAEAPGPDALARVFPHRLFGELDVEEWLYFASLHCQRHVAQIAELRAAPGFPASA